MENEELVRVNDFHLHTAISPCAPRDTRAEDHIDLAEKFGLTKIGITDHCWDMAVPGHWDFYEEQSLERILTVKETIRQREGLTVYVGCEVDMREDCTIAMLPEHQSLFDYVLIPTDHFHMNRNTPEASVSTDDGVRKILLNRFSAAVNSELPDHGIIGLCHPFCASSFGGREENILKGISDSIYAELFSIAAERHIFIEVNSTMLRNTVLRTEEHDLPGEYVRFYTIAKECGCRIYFGSDSHAGKMFEEHHHNGKVNKLAEVCGFTYSDII